MREEMPEKTIRLAQLLTTRLCHDLAGPIGAVNNGIEFLGEEAAEIREDALQLAASSAAQALQRLQFYRHLYGIIKQGGEASNAELQQLATKAIQTDRLAIDWSGWLPDATLTRQKGQLLLHMVLLVSQSLLKGGTVRVMVRRDGESINIQVEGSGDMVRFNPHIAEAARQGMPESDITPENVQACLFYALTRKLGLHYGAEVSDQQLRLTLATA